MVVEPIEIPPVGFPFPEISRILVCGNFGVKTAGCVVVVRIEIPPVGCPGFAFDRLHCMGINVIQINMLTPGRRSNALIQS